MGMRAGGSVHSFVRRRSGGGGRRTAPPPPELVPASVAMDFLEDQIEFPFMANRWEENHEQFKERLVASEPAKLYVARWLHSQGFPVIIRPLRVAPTRKEAQFYSDNGDLEILHRVEAKHLSREFTGPQDWPYPDKSMPADKKEFYVCSKSSYDRADPKPLWYFYLSNSHECAARVWGGRTQKWWVKDVTDSKTGETQATYVAPLSVVTFFPLRAFKKKYLKSLGVRDEQPES